MCHTPFEGNDIDVNLFTQLFPLNANAFRGMVYSLQVKKEKRIICQTKKG